MIEPRGVKVDPLSGNSEAFQLSYERINEISFPNPETGWLERWQIAEQVVNVKMQKSLF